MKKGISIFLFSCLLLFSLITQVYATADTEEGLEISYESDSSTTYTVNDYTHEIPYESGTFSLKQIAFTEEKDGAYITEYGGVVLNLSCLNEDERQWINDDFGVLAGDFSVSLFVNIDGELTPLSYVTHVCEPLKDGLPALSVIFSKEKLKHSLIGNRAMLVISFKYNNKHVTYNYYFQVCDALIEE